MTSIRQHSEVKWGIGGAVLFFVANVIALIIGFAKCYDKGGSSACRTFNLFAVPFPVSTTSGIQWDFSSKVLQVIIIGMAIGVLIAFARNRKISYKRISLFQGGLAGVLFFYGLQIISQYLRLLLCQPSAACPELNWVRWFFPWSLVYELIDLQSALVLLILNGNIIFGFLIGYFVVLILNQIKKPQLASVI